MADLDLRTLSAPLEALRSKVDAAYKLLDEQWKAIAAQLSELPIPCSVSYTYWEDEHNPMRYSTLDWRKMKGGKRLCTVYHYLEQGYEGDEEAEDVTSYEEWSAELRLEMLKHVPGLFDAAVKQTEAFVKRIHGNGGSK